MICISTFLRFLTFDAKTQLSSDVLRAAGGVNQQIVCPPKFCCVQKIFYWTPSTIGCRPV